MFARASVWILTAATLLELAVGNIITDVAIIVEGLRCLVKPKPESHLARSEHQPSAAGFLTVATFADVHNALLPFFDTAYPLQGQQPLEFRTARRGNKSCAQHPVDQSSGYQLTVLAIERFMVSPNVVC
jgi:hypothetical protein